MTLQQYINALHALPQNWKDADREAVPLCFCGDLLIAAHGQCIMGYNPSSGTWKDPNELGGLVMGKG